MSRISRVEGTVFPEDAWGDGSVSAMLMYKHEDLVPPPGTHTAQTAGTGSPRIIPVLGRQRQADPWGPLPSQSLLTKEF